MSYIISNLTNDIKISGTAIVGEMAISKSHITDIKVNGDGTSIYINLSRSTANNCSNTVEIVYASVTSPATSSIAMLRDLLLVYKGSSIFSMYGSTALEASEIVKATAGTLKSINVVNTGGAQYIQLHDSATLPIDTTVPKISYYIAAGGVLNIPLSGGMSFANGIVICNSSTAATKTIGAADCLFQIEYI